MKDTFLLISLPRSGTKLLASALGSHADIACEHAGKYQLSDSNVEAYRLRAKYNKPKVVLHAQAYHLISHPFLLDLPVPKLMIARDDEVRGAISECTQSFGRREGGKDNKFTLRPEMVERVYQERMRFKAILTDAADLIVSYEDIVRDMNQQQLGDHHSELLCNFMEVEKQALFVSTEADPPCRPTNMEDIYARCLNH